MKSQVAELAENRQILAILDGEDKSDQNSQMKVLQRELHNFEIRYNQSELVSSANERFLLRLVHKLNDFIDFQTSAQSNEF